MTDAVCGSESVLILRSVLWPVVLFTIYDCYRRFGYVRRTHEMPNVRTDHPYEARTALRHSVRDVLTPLGYAFSKWVHPEERTEGGNASSSNIFVNVIALVAATAAIPAFLYLAGGAADALSRRAWPAAATELAVAVAATLLSFLLSRRIQSRGLALTALAVVAGALIGGWTAGYLLCTSSQSRAAAASVRVYINI